MNIYSPIVFGRWPMDKHERKKRRQNVVSLNSHLKLADHIYVQHAKLGNDLATDAKQSHSHFTHKHIYISKNANISIPAVPRRNSSDLNLSLFQAIELEATARCVKSVEMRISHPVPRASGLVCLCRTTEHWILTEGERKKKWDLAGKPLSWVGAGQQLETAWASIESH